MAKNIKFNGRILMIGFGSVGHCTMPLIARHFDMPLARVAVVEMDDHGEEIAPYVAKGVTYEIKEITRRNFKQVLAKYAGPGDLVLNLSVSVSSHEVLEWCHKHGALYLDTCIEPWPGYYDNPKIPAHQRSNYYLRYEAKEMAKKWPKGSPSAILTMGANPGIISHFVKAGILEVARDRNPKTRKPATREAWARLAMNSGLKVIHVAERDTQIANIPKRMNEFVNTWSIHGFVSEGLQPAELGWGTHEKRLPLDANEHPVGPKCAIYLSQPGCVTQVRSWTPLHGEMIGFCITHGESITLSDYLTVFDGERPIYRPTVHYAYHPCDDAVLSVRELQMHGFKMQSKIRLMGEEIVYGMDELGALLMGDFGALWYGSQLTIEEARALLGPQFNATSIQIAAPVMAGAMWMIEHPQQGLLEPEDLDHDFVLEVCRPFLGKVVAARSDWTPLKGRAVLFPEPGLDRTDPWQFQNFRVT
jgi:homospermidine synthase